MVACPRMRSLKLLQQTISDCTLCPRLTTYRREIARQKVKRFMDWDYWGRPIPGFGDPKARLYVLDWHLPPMAEIERVGSLREIAAGTGCMKPCILLGLPINRNRHISRMDWPCPIAMWLRPCAVPRLPTSLRRKNLKPAGLSFCRNSSCCER